MSALPPLRRLRSSRAQQPAQARRQSASPPATATSYRALRPISTTPTLPPTTSRSPRRTSSIVNNVTFAGAGAGSYAAGIAVAVNVIDNTVEAAIANGAIVDTTSGSGSHGTVALTATGCLHDRRPGLRRRGRGHRGGRGGRGRQCSDEHHRDRDQCLHDQGRHHRQPSFRGAVSGYVRWPSESQAQAPWQSAVSALGNYVGDTVDRRDRRRLRPSRPQGNVSITAEEIAPSLLSPFTLTGTTGTTSSSRTR